ncbi:MAG: VOC family protein [Myxococcota bacterium]|jgi:catechol 2,3-dioxygenase-like lactoylglutathione lyase family enzyme|nr:VOC family protein [Myxococcota bacterium]
MIGYVMLGTNDLARASAFYDALLTELGASRTLEEEDHFVAWANAEGSPILSLSRPFDQKPASVGNGTMVALALQGPDRVDAVYRVAIDLGAADEGSPGERSPGFYAGYFRDPDSNKLCVYSLEVGGT